MLVEVLFHATVDGLMVSPVGELRRMASAIVGTESFQKQPGVTPRLLETNALICAVPYLLSADGDRVSVLSQRMEIDGKRHSRGEGSDSEEGPIRADGFVVGAWVPKPVAVYTYVPEGGWRVCVGSVGG